MFRGTRGDVEGSDLSDTKIEGIGLATGMAGSSSGCSSKSDYQL